MRCTIISLTGRIATVRCDGFTNSIQAALIKSVVSGDVVAGAIGIVTGNNNTGFYLIGIVG